MKSLMQRISVPHKLKYYVFHGGGKANKQSHRFQTAQRMVRCSSETQNLSPPGCQPLAAKLRIVAQSERRGKNNSSFQLQRNGSRKRYTAVRGRCVQRQVHTLALPEKGCLRCPKRALSPSPRRVLGIALHTFIPSHRFFCRFQPLPSPNLRSSRLFLRTCIYVNWIVISDASVRFFTWVLEIQDPKVIHAGIHGAWFDVLHSCLSAVVVYEEW